MQFWDGFMWVPVRSLFTSKFCKSTLAVFSLLEEADGWSKAPACLFHLRGTFGSLQASCLLPDSDCHCEMTFAFSHFHSNQSREWHFCFLIINWLWERTSQTFSWFFLNRCQKCLVTVKWSLNWQPLGESGHFTGHYGWCTMEVQVWGGIRAPCEDCIQQGSWLEMRYILTLMAGAEQCVFVSL